MNTLRTALFTTFLLLITTAASGEVYRSTPQKIREVPNELVEVEIWTNRGDDARYCAGDSIEIFFRTNIDAWVAIYDTDTSGRTHKLFPSRHAPDNFVRGGKVHRVPARYGHHFEVEGPSGWETLRAVASTDRYALRNTNRLPGRNWNGHDERDWDRDRGRTPEYRPTAWPASDRVTGVPNKIREVPDEPRYLPEIAVDEARHYVRDGYRCRNTRPWWNYR